MTTVLSLLTDAYIQLGAIDPGETLQASEATVALRELNRMIASWNAEDLMVYTVDRTEFSLTIGKQSYTLGSGGDLNMVRPVVIDMASVLIAGNTVEIPIEILNDDQWRDTTVKAITSSFPLAFWANGNYPLNTLMMWPIPQGACKLVLYTWGQTSAFTNLSATIAFPPAYEDAIVSNLAVRLAPGLNKQVNPVTVALARESKARIKRINWDPVYRSVGHGFGSRYSNVGQRSRGYVID